MRKKPYYKKPVAKHIETSIDGDVSDNLVWDVVTRGNTGKEMFGVGKIYEKPKARVVKEKWNENEVDDLMYRLVSEERTLTTQSSKKGEKSMDQYQESRENILKNKNHPTYVNIQNSKVVENREKLAKDIKKEEDATFLERNGYNFEIGM